MSTHMFAYVYVYRCLYIFIHVCAKQLILSENAVGRSPIVINDVPYNPLTFYYDANEQAQLSKFWMDTMKLHRAKSIALRYVRLKF